MRILNCASKCTVLSIYTLLLLYMQATNRQTAATNGSIVQYFCTQNCVRLCMLHSLSSSHLRERERESVLEPGHFRRNGVDFMFVSAFVCIILFRCIEHCYLNNRFFHSPHLNYFGILIGAHFGLPNSIDGWSIHHGEKWQQHLEFMVLNVKMLPNFCGAHLKRTLNLLSENFIK